MARADTERHSVLTDHTENGGLRTARRERRPEGLHTVIPSLGFLEGGTGDSREVSGGRGWVGVRDE